MTINLIYNYVRNNPVVAPLVTGGIMTLGGVKRIWETYRLTSDDEGRRFGGPIRLTLLGLVVIGASAAKISGLYSHIFGAAPLPYNATHCLLSERPLEEGDNCPAKYDLTFISILEPQLPPPPVGWGGWVKHIVTGR